MKKFNAKFLTLVAALTTIVATTVATSACYWFMYQPEEPKCLRDE
ncbi:MAG: cyclic lactone autoinducer peptide [Clostridium sp.]